MIASADQVCIAQFPVAVTLMPHCSEKCPALPRCKPETETLCNGRRDPAPGHIVGTALALRRTELLIKPSCRIPIGGEKPGTFSGVTVKGILRHLHPSALCQKGDCVRIGEVFDLHDEVDYAAAFATAEAVVKLSCRIYRERWCSLVVKRTEPEKICPAPLPERDIAADHIDDVAAFRQLLNKVFRKWHGVPASSSLFAAELSRSRSFYTPGEGNKQFAVFFHCISVGHSADIVAGSPLGAFPLQNTAEIGGQLLGMRCINIKQ